MSVGVESLFTFALGLVAPWAVAKVELDTVRRRAAQPHANAGLLRGLSDHARSRILHAGRLFSNR